MNTKFSLISSMRFAFLSLAIIIAMILPNSLQARPLLQETAGDEEGHEYVVKAGDYLSAIAQSELGPDGRWRDILDATNERAASDSRFVRIDNPSLLRPGQLLWIPGDEEKEAVIPLPDPEPDPEPGPVPESPCSNPPTVSPIERLYPSTNGDELYGYINIQGDFVIEPRFVVAADFSDGLAVASEDGESFGYIDTSGDFVIEPQFSDAGRFSQGWAPVRHAEEWLDDDDVDFQLSGFIDCQGNSRDFETLYLRTEPYRDGVARVVDQDWTVLYVGLDGEEIIEIQTTDLEGCDDEDEDEDCSCTDEDVDCGEGPSDSIPPALWQWRPYYRSY